MELVNKEGMEMLVDQLAPYFNYSCHAVPLFIQGSGAASRFNVQTEEDGKK